MADYEQEGLQVVFVADGAYKEPILGLVDHHALHGRVVLCDFDERRSHQAYAASDFVLMPSAYEPCGLAQMAAMIYGSLPIVHATGGLRDTVSPISDANGLGNGFVFEHHDSIGLRWAIGEAMRYWRMGSSIKEALVRRVMITAAHSFHPDQTIGNYADLYESLLRRPLLPPTAPFGRSISLGRNGGAPEAVPLRRENIDDQERSLKDQKL